MREDPGIASYPEEPAYKAPAVCEKCIEPSYEGLALWDGRYICKECLEELWAAMSFKEKALNFAGGYLSPYAAIHGKPVWAV